VTTGGCAGPVVKATCVKAEISNKDATVSDSKKLFLHFLLSPCFSSRLIWKRESKQPVTSTNETTNETTNNQLFQTTIMKANNR